MRSEMISRSRSGAVPSRASLSAEIQVKRIYENACEPAQRFYDMLQGDDDHAGLWMIYWAPLN